MSDSLSLGTLGLGKTRTYIYMHTFSLVLLLSTYVEAQGKNPEVGCHSLLQWAMFCRPLHHEPSVLGGPTLHGLVSLS